MIHRTLRSSRASRSESTSACERWTDAFERSMSGAMVGSDGKIPADWSARESTRNWNFPMLSDEAAILSFMSVLPANVEERVPVTSAKYFSKASSRFSFAAAYVGKIASDASASSVVNPKMAPLY